MGSACFMTTSFGGMVVLAYAAPIVWHSDAAAPSRERERAPEESPTKLTPPGAALARTDLSDEFGLDGGSVCLEITESSFQPMRYSRIENAESVAYANNRPGPGFAETAGLAGFQRESWNGRELLRGFQRGKGPGKTDFLRPRKEGVNISRRLVHGQSP